ncbi:MAG: vanadium nitrogenase [Lachnospiraceae bacterium]|nr:vanadium nitrogenase [Lachnospiraceae bacterium]
MIAFLNSFFSYLLLFVVMAAIAGTGIFVGITMRKKKNLSEETKTVDEAQ